MRGSPDPFQLGELAWPARSTPCRCSRLRVQRHRLTPTRRGVGGRRPEGRDRPRAASRWRPRLRHSPPYRCGSGRMTHAPRAEVHVSHSEVAHLAAGQTDGVAPLAVSVVCAWRAQSLVERSAVPPSDTAFTRAGRASPQPSSTTSTHEAVGGSDPARPPTDGRAPRSDLRPSCVAAMIAANARGSRLAPPTSAPVDVGQARGSPPRCPV